MSALRPTPEDIRAVRQGKPATRAVLLVSQNCPACRDVVGRLNLFPQLFKHVQVLDLSRANPDTIVDAAVKGLVGAYLAGGAEDPAQFQRLDGADEESLYRLPALMVERDGRYYRYHDLHPTIERLFYEQLSKESL